MVEDAQYADAGLLDFLDHLIDWARDLPLFVLVFARPELSQERPGFGAGRNRTTLTLDPLDPASMDALVDALVPGMPPAARAAVTGQAQGIPLFAVETVRALIDRDIVQPIDGVYRLVGDVGELAVPDGLHALLAARLDALDPGVRRLVTDAAVLGTTFPAEALIAVSGRDETAVRSDLDELVRREVLTVSANPLSPERGSYQFTQNMLRQVAYDTLSRRDRKARHLKVAAHLRAAFPGDGEEVADVIARHYLDALEAVPDDPDVGEIRGQAIGALIRAAERAERTGAPAMAAASYATAAELASDTPRSPGEQLGEAEEAATIRPDAGMLWEHAAEAGLTSSQWAEAIEHAGRARGYYLGHGRTRAAARAQALAGRGLRSWGRYGEAREQLTAAMEVLGEDPDADTVTALDQLAALEVFAGSPEANRLSAEALILGQALGVSASKFVDLLTGRGIYLSSAERRTEAVAYFHQAARLAEEAGDTFGLGLALVNLANVLSVTDPAVAAETARAAAGPMRRAGAWEGLAHVTGNLVQALLMLGEWDAAEKELTRAMDSDRLGDIERLVCCRGWLAALRGDTTTAQTMLSALPDLRASDDPQDKSLISLVEAFTAAARHQPQDALRHAQGTLAHAAAIGISDEGSRWAWPLAARAAYDLQDTATTRELLVLLDDSPPGHLAPMQRAERDLVRARLAAHDGDPAAAALFAAATTGLREHSTPYHLAHGLLDHAEYLTRLGDTDAAAPMIGEARAMAQKLRCQPLLDRAADLTSPKPRIRA